MKHLICCLTVLFSLSAKADHMTGGEMFYNYLGNNNYRITIVRYFECSDGNYEGDLTIWVYHNNALVKSVVAPFPGSYQIYSGVQSSCITNTETACNYKSVYTTEVYLPSISGYYTIVHQRCCLAQDILNIQESSSKGLTLACNIPGNLVNSSPRYNEEPPLLACTDEQVNFDLSATDPDGDQLVYELIDLYNGGDMSNTIPNPPPPPPFAIIPWQNGFGRLNQLGNGAVCSVNSSTGMLTVNPSQAGLFLIGVRVKEYRNAVCIGQTDREFVMTTMNCNKRLVASFSHADSACLSSNSFDFNSDLSNQNASVSWKFGSHASVTTSAAQDVFDVVYDTAGVFQVTVSALYQGCTRRDTSYVCIIPDATIDFIPDEGLQCAPYTAQFTNLSEPYAPVSYYWIFDDGLPVNSINGEYTYQYPGLYNVGLVMITEGVCPDTLTLFRPDYMLIHPSPVADFKVAITGPANCEHTVQFTDQSIGGINLVYQFGDNQSSSLPNPEHVYTMSGFIQPVQVVTNEFGCRDSSVADLILDPFSVYIPNSFTPNGNEFNQVFNPVTPYPMSLWELRIYNRWRDLIFVSRDPSVGWDGTFNKELVPSGTYTYILEYEGCNGETKELIGHVNVLR